MIVPSLPADTYTDICSLADALRGVATELQIDIVDGLFVQHTSWPFMNETDVHEALQRLRTLTADFSLEVDCMVKSPETYLHDILTAGAVRVVVHYGSTTAYETILTDAHAAHALVGLAVTNNDPLEEVYALIPSFDYVQVMGIEAVGQQGQPFDERTIATIQAIRTKWPELEIAVDGAVNTETIGVLKNAGANRFAPGSAITRATDPAAAYQHLASLV